MLFNCRVIIKARSTYSYHWAVKSYFHWITFWYLTLSRVSLSIPSLRDVFCSHIVAAASPDMNCILSQVRVLGGILLCVFKLCVNIFSFLWQVLPAIGHESKIKIWCNISVFMDYFYKTNLTPFNQHKGSYRSRLETRLLMSSSHSFI
jgi:hypothetical protein